MPAEVSLYFPDGEGASMTVMIGVDPHKGSHTAVAVDATELKGPDRKSSASTTATS